MTTPFFACKALIGHFFNQKKELRESIRDFLMTVTDVGDNLEVWTRPFFFKQIPYAFVHICTLIMNHEVKKIPKIQWQTKKNKPGKEPQ